MLDADLAGLYGVTTKRLNEQVRRNRSRFPDDFMFQLTAEEVLSLRSQIATSKQGRGGRRYAPLVFTEQGIAMLSTVLNTERAIQVNIEIMRAFVRLREMIATHRDLARKLETLETKYDAQFKVVFDAIRELMTPPESKKRKIGFLVKERAARYGRGLSCHFHVFGIAKTWKCVSERVVKPRQITGISHFDVLRIIKTSRYFDKRAEVVVDPAGWMKSAIENRVCVGCSIPLCINSCCTWRPAGH